MNAVRIQVKDSSLIKSLISVGAELEIEFVDGRRYRYMGVPLEVIHLFEGSESKGKFFNTAIKGQYPFKELKR